MARALTVGRLGMLAAVVLCASGGGWPSAARAQILRPRFVPQPPLAVAVGFDAGRQAMALADLNGDQRLDLVAIDPDQSRLDIYLNRGNGAFDLVATPELLEGVTPTAVAVADVASPFFTDAAGRPDGKLDLVVGGDGGEVEVLFGRNDGQFDPAETVVEPDATSGILGLVVGEFDQQSGLDVALLDEDGVVLLCNDNGNLYQCSGDDPIETGIDPIAIAGGDFNGDGRRDVAVLDGDDQRVWPLLGNGNASFTAGDSIDVAGETVGSRAVDLAVGRLDADALDDLVIVNDDEFAVYIGVALFGKTDGTFRSQPFVVDFNALSVAVADFDATGDGANDVITGYEDFGLTINIGDGHGGLTEPVVAPGSNSVGGAALMLAGDLDGDAIADLVVLNGDGDHVRVLLNGKGTTPSVCTGDCNGNGTVSVDELVRGVGILLGESNVSGCLSLDVDGNALVTVNELVAAVAQDLVGCPARPV